MIFLVLAVFLASLAARTALMPLAWKNLKFAELPALPPADLKGWVMRLRRQYAQLQWLQPWQAWLAWLAIAVMLPILVYGWGDPSINPDALLNASLFGSIAGFYAPNLAKSKKLRAWLKKPSSIFKLILIALGIFFWTVSPAAGFLYTIIILGVWFGWRVITKPFRVIKKVIK